MSGKHCRPRSHAAFCGVWSESTLFVQALSKYLKGKRNVWKEFIWNERAWGIVHFYENSIKIKCKKEATGVWRFQNYFYGFAILIINLSCWTRIYPAFANSVESDQLAFEEASWSGSALFAIYYVTVCQQSGLRNLTGWQLKVGVASEFIQHDEG